MAVVAAAEVVARETSHRVAQEAATEVVNNTPTEDVEVAVVAIEEVVETIVMKETAIATPPGDTKTVKALEIATIADTGDITTDRILVALRNRAPLTKNVTVETRILREGLTMDQTTR